MKKTDEICEKKQRLQGSTRVADGIPQLETHKIGRVSSGDQKRICQLYFAPIDKRYKPCSLAAVKMLHEKLCGENDALSLRDSREDTQPVAQARYPLFGRGGKPEFIEPWLPAYRDFKAEDHPLLPIPRPQENVELRAGDLLKACECLKRNGLQSDCPLSDCRGHFECLTYPLPSCQPSGLGVPIKVEASPQPDGAKCENEAVAVIQKKTEQKRYRGKLIELPETKEKRTKKFMKEFNRKLKKCPYREVLGPKRTVALQVNFETQMEENVNSQENASPNK